MSVSDFLTDFSDCHCKLTLKLLASFQKESINNNLKELPCTVHCRYTWTETSSIHFQNSFTHPLVKKELDNFLSTEIHLNGKGIDNATEAIDTIMHTAADFGLKKKRPKNKFRHQSKNWFDFDLKVKKKEVYNKARLMSMFPNDPQVRDRPFNLKGEGGYGFLFRSEFFFRTTQELEYLFFLSRKARIFFPDFNIRLYDKTQIIFFFLHQNQNIFFSNIGNQNIFLENNHNPPPPFKLNGHSLKRILLQIV